MTHPDTKLKVGDLVQHQGERLGIVISEVFDMRPRWEDSYPAVEVRTKHEHTGEEGVWMWMLDDIEVLGECQ